MDHCCLQNVWFSGVAFKQQYRKYLYWRSWNDGLLTYHWGILSLPALQKVDTQITRVFNANEQTSLKTSVTKKPRTKKGTKV